MIKQYGAIPFVREGRDLRVVLITSARGYWIFPKGNYEKALGKRGTAEQEAFEEAGVKGRFSNMDAYRTKVAIHSGDRVHLTLYPLEVHTVLDHWPEESRRERRIVKIEKAMQLLDSKALKKCLEKFRRDFPA